MFFEGLVAGLVPALFVGPVLFTLMSASLESGFQAGLQVALGIAVSDVIAVVICALGIGVWSGAPLGQWVLHLLAGLILTGFGTALALSRASETDPAVPRPAWRSWWLAGFLVNFVNPFVFTFWVGALGALDVRAGLGWDVVVPFFGGMIATIFLTDVCKAAFASRLESLLAGHTLRWIRRISGGLLAAGGIWYLSEVVRQFGSLVGE